MLINTTLPISQIAEQLGYADPLYFSRKFHKQTGVSPTAYREKYGEQDR
jgi:AraC-like DNA-binding protein